MDSYRQWPEDTYIWYMAADLHIPNRLLLSTKYDLMSVSKSHTEAFNITTVAKKVIRKYIFGFVQTNSSIIVASSWTCLFTFDRISRKASKFVGDCNQGLRKDGSFTEARFRQAYQIIQGLGTNKHLLFVGDGFHIRKINAKLRTVTSIFESSQRISFYDVVWNASDSNILLYATQYTINAVAISCTYEDAERHVVGSSSGYEDGNLNAAKFSGIGAIVALTEHIYFVTDKYRLRLIDFKNKRITSVCSETSDSTATGASTSTCRLNLKSANSAVLRNGTLYLGGYGISTVKGI